MSDLQPFLNQTTLNIPFAIGEMIIALFAVFGNLLVLVSFCRVRSLRHARSYFLMSLAMADFFVGIVCIPIILALSIGYPEGNLYGCLGCLATLRVLHCTSMLSYLLVTLDRFWAIGYPYSYLRRMKSKFAIGAVIICWVISIIFGLIVFFGFYNRDGWAKSGHRCFFIHVVDYQYQLITNVLIVSLTTITVGSVYGFIFRALRKQKVSPSASELKLVSNLEKQRNIEDPVEDVVTAEQITCSIFTAKFRGDATLAMRLGKIMTVFMICQMPFATVLTLWAFCPYEDCSVPTYVIVGGVLVFHGSAASNPFLYAFHLPEFRTSMKNTLLNLFSCFRTQVNLSNTVNVVS